MQVSILPLPFFLVLLSRVYMRKTRCDHCAYHCIFIVIALTGNKSLPITYLITFICVFLLEPIEFNRKSNSKIVSPLSNVLKNMVFMTATLLEISLMDF